VVNGSCLADAVPPIGQDIAANPLCASWKGSQCLACASRSFTNANGICQAVSDNCNTWDKLDGYCLTCYAGYDLVNGTCLFSSSNTAPVTDAGCKVWQNGKCNQCSDFWTFNSNGACIPVNDQCKTYNTTDGECLSCYSGYDLVNGSCLYSESNSAKPTDAGCSTWDWANAKCTVCSTNWVFDSNGLCIPVSDQCRTSNTQGLCDSCYRGYDIVNGSCVFSSSNSAPLADAGCHIWNWTTNACEVCSDRWVLANTGACAQVSDLCETYSSNGFCSSCYAGYDLANGTCVYSSSNTAAPADSGCSKWVKGACQACSVGWVFNANGKCITVSDQCKTYDAASGDCLSCYNGYDLVNGSCLYSESNNAKPTDGGCAAWDWANAKCKSCSTNWVFDSNGLCITVSDQCRTANTNGLCDSCYRGYDLVNGSCVFSSSNSAPLADAGCKVWNWTANSCEVCSSSWYFVNGVCAQISNLCKSSDSNGLCLSCYLGYDLVNGTCLVSSSNFAPPTDPGCSDWVNGVCKACSNWWAFNSNGVCTAVSSLCKTNQGLDCTSCYNGYVLTNGSCLLSSENAFPTDAGCAKWNWATQTCLACSSHWFSLNGVCVPVSSQCNTYDSTTGDCLSCYKGYDLVNGSCLVSSKNSKPTDPGCADWNWDSQVCLSCSKYWVLINGTCESVSPNCKSYDATGACTSCFTGFSLGNGTCSAIQVLCKSQDSNGACLTCYNGFALYSGKCVNLSNLANIALYYAACCPEKLAQLQAEGRIPQ
jgi:proprotein convertase subtilisin/kexin type 5